MEKLTHEQKLVIMGFTGISTMDFDIWHKDLEKRLGKPVLTHHIPYINNEIKETYKEDFLSML